MRTTVLSAAIVAGLSIFGLSYNNDAASTTSTPTTKPAPVKTISKKEVAGAQLVTVQSGDTLSSIADSKGTSVERLFYANTAIESPDVIQPGEQLRVPAADEQLAERPMPARAAPVAPSEPAETTPVDVVPEAVPSAPRSSAPVQAPAIAGGSVWDSLAACESGGNWAINTGNGFYGGLQFTISSWQAVGGSGLPSDASREEQIMRGQSLQAIQGWGAWPACSAKLGLL